MRHASHRVSVVYMGYIVETGQAATVTFTPEHPPTDSIAALRPGPRERLRPSTHAVLPRLVELESRWGAAAQCPSLGRNSRVSVMQFGELLEWKSRSMSSTSVARRRGAACRRGPR